MGFMAVLPTAICMTGCDRSVSEQYATALAILEQEERQLDQLERPFELACEDYAHIDRQEQTVQLTFGSNQKLPASMADTQQLLDNLERHRAASKLIDLEIFTSRAKDDSTSEASRLDRWAKSKPALIVGEYREQKRRVNLARDQVDKLQSQINAAQ
jgi:hypothetical protein